ncbi:MAG: hypothetical protein ACTHJ7_07645 [Candidatus Nitrosocosmicus sp.]
MIDRLLAVKEKFIQITKNGRGPTSGFRSLINVLKNDVNNARNVDAISSIISSIIPIIDY